MSRNWPDVLSLLVTRRDLDHDAAVWAMDEILSGAATPAQIAAFSALLRAKGETVTELSALAEAMVAKATPISLPPSAVDVVGTGGDRANTVNVSTMAALVAAACGAQVVKHGNRAASSACGTADCLEELGVSLTVPPQRQSDVLAECGIVFLFAPLYHQSLRFAGGPRRELGIATTFNFLGPLANPARPVGAAVGCADATMAPLMAGVLAQRGGRGLVFHGDDGLDELTTTCRSRVWLFADGRVRETTFDPRDLAITPVSSGDLVGGVPSVNAAIVRDTFAGKPGAIRDIVALNAAATLLAFHGPDLDLPVATQLAGNLTEAQTAIDSGSVAAKLAQWVSVTQAFTVA